VCATYCSICGLDVLIGPLARLGAGVSLDHFGLGTSSLVRPKSPPIDQLKIDKSFTTRVSVDPTDHAIVASTIELGHNLGLRVTARDIETAGTYHRLLHALGCDTA
jgi:EAL domain-containing protein (putative c-di-GMP-specific phosphodiesterase class I)